MQCRIYFLSLLFLMVPLIAMDDPTAAYQKALLENIMMQNLLGVNSLLGHGISPNFYVSRPDGSQYTPIHLALETNNPELVNLILTRADLSLDSSFLCFAASQKPKPRQRIEDQNIFIQNRNKILSSLLDNPSLNLDCKNQYGQTALSLVIETENSDLVNKMLSTGRIESSRIKAALDSVSHLKKESMRRIKDILRSHGAVPKGSKRKAPQPKPTESKSPKIQAEKTSFVASSDLPAKFHQELSQAVMQENIPMVHALLKQGVGSPDPLLINIAITKNNPELIAVLLYYGADPNHALNELMGNFFISPGQNPHNAQANRAQIINFLISNPHIDLNKISGPSAMTPLMIAVSLNDEVVVQKLLETKRIKLNTQNIFGKTALDLIKGNTSKAKELRKLFQDYGMSEGSRKAPPPQMPSPAPAASFKSQSAQGREFGYHPIPQAAKPSGQTIGEVLFKAIEQGDISMLDTLKKAPLDINGINVRYNLTPLAYAAKMNSILTLRKLREFSGININAPNSDGMTPLIVAVSYGSADSVKELLNWPGIAINARDNNNNTALTYALQNPFGSGASIVKLLQAKGAPYSQAIPPAPKQAYVPPPVAKPQEYRPPVSPQAYAALKLSPNASAFEILGIRPSALYDQRRKAWKDKTFEWHPDHNPSPYATEIITLINWAWSKVKDLMP